MMIFGNKISTKKFVSKLQNKGKNVFDIKQAIIKYSPVNMPTEELKNYN